MLCKICSKEARVDKEGYCGECSSDIGHYSDSRLELEADGHTKECAVRIVYGDGLCQCGANVPVLDPT